MTSDQCRYTGLAVTHAESFTCSASPHGFRADIAKIGENMLLLKAYGYITSFVSPELLAFIDDFILKRFLPGERIVYMEDYAALDGADAEARKKYITYLKNHHDFIGIILYSLSPVFRISFNLAKKLHIYASKAHAVNTYQQAADLARQLLDQNRAFDQAGPEPANAFPYMARHQSGDLISARFLRGFFARFFSKFTRMNPFLISKIQKKLATQYSDALIKYIASIDWKTPGLPSLENFFHNDFLSKSLYDAIDFVKSEIDTLMEERNSAEAVLRESETRYRLLVEHAKAGFLEYDFADSRIAAVNDELVQMSGYSKQELLAMQPHALIGRDSLESYKKRLAKILAGEPVSQDAVFQSVKKKRRCLVGSAEFKYR